MKSKPYYFVPVTLLSLFISITPALSQVLYKATVSRPNGGQSAQVASNSDLNQLANSIYKLIKPQGNRRPNVTVSLGTVDLNTFENLLRSKGISAQYYEHLGSSSFSKSPWQKINIPSVRSKSKSYGMVLTKSGYTGTAQIPFNVMDLRNNTPIFKFDRSQVNLKDGTTITFTIDAGNSGLNPTQLGTVLTRQDSRLSMLEFHSNTRNVSDISNVMPRDPMGCAQSVVQAPCGQGNGGNGGNNADYLIKLSRN